MLKQFQEVNRLIQFLLNNFQFIDKIKWLLDNIEGAREKSLAAGTIDTFLLWRLTGGRVHATDWTNAGRTMLYDIHERRWDAELLGMFDIPESLLPQVHPNAHEFGETDPAILPACESN